MFTISLPHAHRCTASARDECAVATRAPRAAARHEAQVGRTTAARAWLRQWAFVVSSAVACLLLGQAGAQAAATEAVVGSVIAVRGAVFLDAGGGQQPLVVKAPVHRGDTIVSAAGKAQIGLLDGTIVSIGENSRMQVADFDTAGGSTKARVGLMSGALRLLVNKIAPSGRFEVETETAVAAVRGTDWVIEATPAQTSVAIVSGVVAVTGRAAEGASTVVLGTRGQGTDVARGMAPTPVATWGEQRFTQTLARATFE